ncbi:MAG: HAD-IA family hydrolase [Hyphomonadaceae bacterium]|nr:HAD-IA family hydrolase [Hyphomonadaceae bacterium]
MTFRFAVFDIDGTLVDSRAIITACMDKAFIGAGMPPPGFERTRRVIGLSLAPGLAYLAPQADDALRTLILESYRTAFFEMRQDPTFHSPAYDGADALLRSLLADNWVLGIATGKSHRGLDAMLEQHAWGHLFQAHFCADDGPGKPHPHMVLENMRVVGAQPDQTLVIGDSEHDMAMAIAAGTTAIGVSWGFGTTEEMLAAGAVRVTHQMGELEEALKSHELSL